MRRGMGLLLGLALLLAAGRAEAASIAVVPSSASVAPGGLVTVDVVISGLGAGSAPSLSGFDLDLAFGAPSLGFVSIAFGTALGTGGQVLSSVSVLPGPLVDFAQASLLASGTLDSQQPASFVLATLTFEGLTPGLAALSVTQAVLADTSAVPGGNQIPVEALTGAAILVTPEPGTAALLAAGLAAVAARRRRASA